MTSNMPLSMSGSAFPPVKRWTRTVSRVADLQMFRDLLKTLQSLEHATERLKGRQIVSPRANEQDLFTQTVLDLAAEASDLYEHKIAEWKVELRESKDPEDLKALCGKMDLLRAFVSLAYLCFNKVCKIHDNRRQSTLSAKCLERIFAEKFYSSMQLADLIIDVRCRLAQMCGIRREDFTCGLCGDVAERPCVLTCAHAFCLHCLRDADFERVGDRRCPACQKIYAFDGTLRVHKELYAFITAHVNTALDDDPTPRKRRRLRKRTKRGKKGGKLRKKKVLACFTLGASLPQGFSPSTVYRSIHERAESPAARKHRESGTGLTAEWNHAPQSSSSSSPFSSPPSLRRILFTGDEGKETPLPARSTSSSSSSSSSLLLSPFSSGSGSVLEDDTPKQIKRKLVTLDQFLQEEAAKASAEVAAAVGLPPRPLHWSSRVDTSPALATPRPLFGKPESKSSLSSSASLPAFASSSSLFTTPTAVRTLSFTLPDSEESATDAQSSTAAERCATPPVGTSATDMVLATPLKQKDKEQVKEDEELPPATPRPAAVAPMDTSDVPSTPAASPPPLSPEPRGPTCYRLQRVRHLLRHASPRCFIALDIDDVLITSRYHPSSLMTSAGVQRFQQLLKSDPKFNTLPLVHKNKVTRKLQAALHEKRLVEKETAEVIRTLQMRGCCVFAVTSRYGEMAEGTNRVLAEHGIDFARSSPFPQSAIRDPETEALFRDGVLYTNATDKGMVLNRFLEQVVFRGYLAPFVNEAHYRPPLPTEIVFVDDRISNAQSVLLGLPWAATHGIPLVCYHYALLQELDEDEHLAQRLVAEPLTSVAEALEPLREDAVDPPEKSLDPTVIHVQVAHFVEHGAVLDDWTARAILRREQGEAKSIAAST